MFNRLWHRVKTNKYNFFCAFTLMCFFFVNWYLIVSKLPEDANVKHYYFGYALTVVLVVGITFLVKYLIRKEVRIEKIFLFLGCVLGFFFMVLSPFYTGSDEHNHFYRIYEITDGDFKTPTGEYVGGIMPRSLVKMYYINNVYKKTTNCVIKYKSIINMLKIKLDADDVMQYGTNNTNSYENTALYSPITYMPHIVGVCFGKLFYLRPYLIGMLGRLSNLICYLALGYLALKIIPKYKLFFLAILLSPNMMQLATTLSADAFTNIIFLLIISYIYYLYDKKRKINFSDEIALFILSIIISLSKIVYLPIVGAVLLIRSSQFKKGKKEKWCFALITIGISTLVSLLWIKGTKEIFDIAYYHSPAQKEFILHHLFQYGLILLNTFYTYGAEFIECLFGGTRMYHTQLDLPSIVSYAYVTIVVICLMKEKVKNKFSNFERLATFVVGFIIVILAATAIYIQCTAQYYAVANPLIEGIQGRYFIPVVFLIPFMIKGINKNVKIDNNVILNSILTLNIITIFYIINQFIA